MANEDRTGATAILNCATTFAPRRTCAILFPIYKSVPA